MPYRSQRQVAAYAHLLKRYGVSPAQAASIVMRKIKIHEDTPFDIEDDSIHDASHEWDAKENE